MKIKDMMDLLLKIRHQDAYEAGLDVNKAYHLEIEEVNE